MGESGVKVKQSEESGVKVKQSEESGVKVKQSEESGVKVKHSEESGVKVKQYGESKPGLRPRSAGEQWPGPLGRDHGMDTHSCCLWLLGNHGRKGGGGGGVGAGRQPSSEIRQMRGHSHIPLC